MHAFIILGSNIVQGYKYHKTWFNESRGLKLLITVKENVVFLY